MTSPAPRRLFNVGARKIPPFLRDVAHSVITPEDDRGYQDILGSDSDHVDGMARFPYGADVAYVVELTEDEAEAFRAASNCRYVERQMTEADGIVKPRAIGRLTGAAAVPSSETLAWSRARYVDLRQWHGRDVLISILDDGTTQAMRNTANVTMVARKDFSGNPPDPVTPGGHSCLTTSNAVPPGGQFLDATVWGKNDEISDSGIAQAIVWSVDNAAKLMVISISVSTSDPNATMQQVVTDAMGYARDRNVHVVCAAGNDNFTVITPPSNYSRSFSNVHSSIAFDESTDRRSLFSNHESAASGCTPGVDVFGVDFNGQLIRWNGTSASSPNMCRLLAYALTGGQFTPDQVGAAFKNNTRSTGASSSEQGHGAYDLYLALRSLGAVPGTPTTSGVSAVEVVDVRGIASFAASVNLTPATSIQPEDMQIAIVVCSYEAGLVCPPGWRVIVNWTYAAAWERSTNPSMGLSRAYVLTRTYTTGDPSSDTLSWGGSTHDFALTQITLRAPGGLDPERFVPIARFGVSNQVSTVAVQPATANDLHICVFAQRHNDATNATLSLPTGLTQRGFWRPSGRSIGYPMLVTTRQLTDGNRTSTYTSTSNSSTDTWTSIAMTIPAGDPPLTATTQAELAGPPGGAVLHLPHA